MNQLLHKVQCTQNQPDQPAASHPQQTRALHCARFRTQHPFVSDTTLALCTSGGMWRSCVPVGVAAQPGPPHASFLAAGACLHAQVLVATLTNHAEVLYQRQADDPALHTGAPPGPQQLLCATLGGGAAAPCVPGSQAHIARCKQGPSRCHCLCHTAAVGNCCPPPGPCGQHTPAPTSGTCCNVSTSTVLSCTHLPLVTTLDLLSSAPLYRTWGR